MESHRKEKCCDGSARLQISKMTGQVGRLSWHAHSPMPLRSFSRAIERDASQMTHTCKAGGCGIFESLHASVTGVHLVFLPHAIEHHSGGGTSLVLVRVSKGIRLNGY